MDASPNDTVNDHCARAFVTTTNLRLRLYLEGVDELNLPLIMSASVTGHTAAAVTAHFASVVRLIMVCAITGITYPTALEEVLAYKRQQY